MCVTGSIDCCEAGAHISAMAPGCRRIGRSTTTSMSGSGTSWFGVTRCRRAAPIASPRRRCSARSESCGSGVSILAPRRVPRSESQSESRMREIRTSGLMSGEGRRVRLPGTAPLLDSTDDRCDEGTCHSSNPEEQQKTAADLDEVLRCAEVVRGGDAHRRDRKGRHTKGEACRVQHEW